MTDRATGTQVDVVMYPSGEVKAVPAGKGDDIVRSYRERKRKMSTVRRMLLWVIVAVIVAYSILIVRAALMGILAAGIVFVAFYLVPQLRTDADLLDADLTLRDAREQWDAEPVSSLSDGREQSAAERHEREHAFE